MTKWVEDGLEAGGAGVDAASGEAGAEELDGFVVVAEAHVRHCALVGGNVHHFGLIVHGEEDAFGIFGSAGAAVGVGEAHGDHGLVEAGAFGAAGDPGGGAPIAGHPHWWDQKAVAGTAAGIGADEAPGFALR